MHQKFKRKQSIQFGCAIAKFLTAEEPGRMIIYNRLECKPFPQQFNYLTIIPILHWVPLILAWNLIYPSHILSNLEEVQWGNGMT